MSENHEITRPSTMDTHQIEEQSMDVSSDEISRVKEGIQAANQVKTDDSVNVISDSLSPDPDDSPSMTVNNKTTTSEIKNKSPDASREDIQNQELQSEKESMEVVASDASEISGKDESGNVKQEIVSNSEAPKHIEEPMELVNEVNEKMSPHLDKDITTANPADSTDTAIKPIEDIKQEISNPSSPGTDETDSFSSVAQKPEGYSPDVQSKPTTQPSILSQEKLIVELPPSATTVEIKSTIDNEKGKSDSACAPDPSEPSSSTPDSLKPSSNGDENSKTKEKSPSDSVYHVKWIQFKNQNIAIVTQNENGPCPLLAIINCLLLQGRVKLPAMMEMVTSGQLMEYLGDCILENAPKDIGEAALLNYEQNMQDAMDVFHKLQTGLDVNVKFGGVSDFEYTRECIVFDLLIIPLYHGWLVDPESPEVVAAIGNCSYNQLVEKIISQKNANKEELMTEALIAEEFLERTAAQLTYHGLSELSTTVKEDELCVFFRNNHFSTIYKHKKELFLLVTDQGFLTESNVVWETLCNVEGDGHFVDAQFRTFRKPEASTAPIAIPEVPVGTDQQIDQDYLVALSLQQEQQTQPPPSDNSPTWHPSPDAGLEPTFSDHQLAMRLQEEEDRRAAMAANQRATTQPTQQPRQQSQQQRGPLQHQSSTASSGGGSRKKDKSDCVIL